MERLQGVESASKASRCVILWVTLFALLHCGMISAQEVDSRSYILLDHGGILHGAARPVGNKIEIRLSERNLIQVDSKNIAFIGATKEDIYDFQSKTIRSWGVNEHWHMTQWCVQNDLVEQALFHFKEVEKESAPTPKFKQLENLVKAAILRSEPVKKFLAEQQAHHSSTGIPSNDQGPMVGLQSEVKLASATIPIEYVTEIKTGSIPSYVRKTFQQSITPILVSKCGQAGCHGLPGKSSFHIYQPVGEQAAETAVQNLLSVLKYVDAKKPNNSPLLAYATNPHGIQKHPSLNPLKESDHTTIARVEQWIKSLDTLATSPVSNAVAQAPAGVSGLQPTTITPPLIDVPDTSGTEEPTRSRREKLLNLRNEIGEADPSAKLSKPPKKSTGPVFLNDSEIASLEKAIERLEKQGATKSQKDPFDPDEFNTRFGQKRDGIR